MIWAIINQPVDDEALGRHAWQQAGRSIWVWVRVVCACGWEWEWVCEMGVSLSLSLSLFPHTLSLFRLW